MKASPSIAQHRQRCSMATSVTTKLWGVIFRLILNRPGTIKDHFSGSKNNRNPLSALLDIVNWYNLAFTFWSSKIPPKLKYHHCLCLKLVFFQGKLSLSLKLCASGGSYFGGPCFWNFARSALRVLNLGVLFSGGLYLVDLSGTPGKMYCTKYQWRSGKPQCKTCRRHVIIYPPRRHTQSSGTIENLAVSLSIVQSNSAGGGGKPKSRSAAHR